MRSSVVAVVLNYGHPDDTERCVASLGASRYRNLSVIVVDNGSGLDVQNRLRRTLDPAVSLVLNEQNLGYAAGNNVGITEALRRGADLVWLVNPDIVADPGALSILVDTAESHPDAGIVGSRILFGGTDPATIWFDGGVIDWSKAAATSHLHSGQDDAAVPASGPYPVDYVTGAGMLIRSEVLNEVGLLPEQWFLYFEETAYNVDVQRAGWTTIVHPASRLWHHKRSSGLLPQPYYMYYFVRNRLIFGVTYGGASFDTAFADVAGFVAAWRRKVEHRAPTWLTVYDQLVEIAIEHGREGRTGQWQGLDGIEAPRQVA